MKKYAVCFIVILSIIFTSNLCFAVNNEQSTVILKNTYFSPPTAKSAPSVIIPRGPAYTYGTVNISDRLDPANGWTTQLNKQFSSFSVFKEAMILVVGNIPLIGQYLEKGFDIYNLLKTFFNDLDYITYNKPVIVETAYSIRNFSHDLLVYDYTNTWKNVGWSLSRCYFKHTYLRYVDSRTGDYKTATKDFTLSAGFAPCVIAKAPHYMQYSYLSSRAYEAWIKKITFRESY
jgi:hypothetical protein